MGVFFGLLRLASVNIVRKVNVFTLFCCFNVNFRLDSVHNPNIPEYNIDYEYKRGDKLRLYR